MVGGVCDGGSSECVMVGAVSVMVGAASVMVGGVCDVGVVSVKWSGDGAGV